MSPFTYESWGLKPIINASGYATPIGGSIMPPEVVQAMSDAAPYFVDMQALTRVAGERIARLVGAEAALVTAGAMSGMLLQAAACMTGTDPARVHRLPDTRGMKNEILYLPSQRVTFFRAYLMAGATLVPIGDDAASIKPDDLDEAFTERTAAVAYILGPRRGAPLSLEEVVATAHRRGVPVILDAATMVPPLENLRAYLTAGADLVTLNGGEGIRGPQPSGILCGKRALVEAAALNSSPNFRCLGRAMKVGKEEMVGLVTALELLASRDGEAVETGWRERLKPVYAALKRIDGLEVSLLEDPEGREGPAAALRASGGWKGPALKDVAAALAAGDPPIRVGYRRDGAHGREELFVRGQTLQDGEAEIVARRLNEELMGRPSAR